MEQFLGAVGRPAHIVNLDPANDATPYTSSVSLSELISVRDVMEELGLGPNVRRCLQGAMLYCMEYLEANLEWLEARLDALEHNYVVFDLPGQVELSTNHPSLKRILERLAKRQDWRVRRLSLTSSWPSTSPTLRISLTRRGISRSCCLRCAQCSCLSCHTSTC